MKKQRILTLVLFACFALLLTACSLQMSHTHTFDTEWSTSETHHWYAATCEHEKQTKDKAKHDWEDAVVVTEATCTEDGKQTKTCKVCEYTKEEVVEAFGHEGEAIYTWNDDYSQCTATFTCTVEGCEYTVTETVDSVSSELEEAIAYTATFEAEVFEEQYVEVTSEGEVVTHTHAYGTPTYEWAADNTTCTATVVCSAEGCQEPTVTETALVVAEKVENTTTYTATFTNALFEAQTKSVVDAHTCEFGEVTYTWNADYTKCTAATSCEVAGCEEEVAETVDATKEVVEELTETTAGLVIYTAIFTNVLFEAQVEEVVVLPTEEVDNTVTFVFDMPNWDGSTLSAPSLHYWGEQASNWDTISATPNMTLVNGAYQLTIDLSNGSLEGILIFFTETKDGNNKLQKSADFKGTEINTPGVYNVTMAENWTEVKNEQGETVEWLWVIELTKTGENKHTHNYEATVTEAACTTPGYTTYACECGSSLKGNFTEPTNHSYSTQTPTYTWSADNTACSAVVKCGNCESTITDEATVTSEVVGDKVVYTAKFKIDLFTTQTKEEDVPDHDHAYTYSYEVIEELLYYVGTCAGCDEDYSELVDTTNPISVSNETDLRFLLTNGYDVVLGADINLKSTLLLEGNVSATLDLSTYTITADWVVEDSYVEAIRVDNGAELTIKGEGTVNGGSGSAQNLAVTTVSGTVNIYGGNYTHGLTVYEQGSDLLYAKLGGVFNIYGGTFVAIPCEGTYYTLDIKEMDDQADWGVFNVYGGSFYNFDPANHTNDGAEYTNKVALGYHSIKEEDYYVVSAHDYEAVVTAPTCEADGYTTYTCACGDTYVADEVATTGHNYSTVVTAPTCTAAGYTTHSCSGCGDSYTDTPTNATGHSHTVYQGLNKTEKAAIYKCSKCTDTKKETKITIYVTHNWEDWSLKIYTWGPNTAGSHHTLTYVGKNGDGQAVYSYEIDLTKIDSIIICDSQNGNDWNKQTSDTNIYDLVGTDNAYYLNWSEEKGIHLGTWNCDPSKLTK